MARFLKVRKEEIGLSPDALELRGDKKSESVLLRLIDYDSQKLNELELKEVKEAVGYGKTKTTSWFNIDGLHDSKIMEEISDRFELDQIILSDVMNTHARPKIFEYENCIYISVKMLNYNDQLDEVSSENLVLIIKENMLITFQERKGDIFEPVRERIRKQRKRIRDSGSDYLAFSLIDSVFSNYSYIISNIGGKIESLEEKLLNNPQPSILEEINNFKSEIIFLRKSIHPCNDLTMSLYRMDSDLIDDDNLVHIKDLQDNINQSIDSLDSYREILSDHLHIYHTTMSSKLNDIMKFLTVFSVIFIPLTFIAGVYGTNFDVLPELHYKYSYPIMLGVMCLLSILMIGYFKRKKWF